MMQKDQHAKIHNGKDWISANWPAPSNIKAGTSCRHKGLSTGPYSSLNLATHVGDELAIVGRNRASLGSKLNLPGEPLWLNQVHGCEVITAGLSQFNTADGCYSDRGAQVCAVLTADCVPLLICNDKGTEIAAIHIGWRGFCSRIIDNAISMFKSEPGQLLAWIGPHISMQNYEVGDEVRDACLAIEENAVAAFNDSRPGHWFANLELLTRIALKRHGLEDIYNSGLCNYAEEQAFFSYRRDGSTGRMASLIWMDT